MEYSFKSTRSFALLSLFNLFMVKHLLWMSFIYTSIKNVFLSLYYISKYRQIIFIIIILSSINFITIFERCRGLFYTRCSQALCKNRCHFLDASLGLKEVKEVFACLKKRYKLFRRSKIWGRNEPFKAAVLLEKAEGMIHHTDKAHLRDWADFTELFSFTQRLRSVKRNVFGSDYWSSAIYKNLQTHLRWPSVEEIMGMEGHNSATKKQGNFNFTKANHYWWHGSTELQSLLFIGIANYRKQTGE